MATDLLKNLYFFKEMPPQALELIEKITKERLYSPGQDIFAQGDKASSLFIVKMGSVKIHLEGSEGDAIEISILGTGLHFGEMAFLDGESRSASATAVEATKLLEINYEGLSSLLEKNPTIAAPFYRSIAQFLCGRLRHTTMTMSQVKDKLLLRHF